MINVNAQKSFRCFSGLKNLKDFSLMDLKSRGRLKDLKDSGFSPPTRNVANLTNILSAEGPEGLLSHKIYMRARAGSDLPRKSPSGPSALWQPQHTRTLLPASVSRWVATLVQGTGLSIPRSRSTLCVMPLDDHPAIPLRVPRTLIARADALAEKRSDPAAGVRRSRAEILRLALARGLASLESEQKGSSR